MTRFFQDDDISPIAGAGAAPHDYNGLPTPTRSSNSGRHDGARVESKQKMEDPNGKRRPPYNWILILL